MKKKFRKNAHAICLAFIAISCSNLCNSQSINSADSLKLKRENWDKRNDCDELTSSNIIGPLQAAGYISEFLNDPNCSNFGGQYGFAGFIRFEDTKMKQVPPYQGFLFFPCVWDRWLLKDQFFISMKREAICPGKSDPNVLISVTDSFVESSVWYSMMDLTSPNAASVLAYLTEEFTVKNPLSISNDFIDPKDVLVSNFNYKMKFASNENYANYGFGFIRQTEFDNFVYQNLPQGRTFSGFCVFLGFASGNNEEKVRMILIGVDDLGNLLLHNTPGGLTSKCIEKSWPPIDPSRSSKKE